MNTNTQQLLEKINALKDNISDYCQYYINDTPIYYQNISKSIYEDTLKLKELALASYFNDTTETATANLIQISKALNEINEACNGKQSLLEVYAHAKYILNRVKMSLKTI